MPKEDLAKLQELMKQRKQLDEALGQFQRMVTMMFVDIVGSTPYFDRFGDVEGMVWVQNCMDMLVPVAEQHGGTISKFIGDEVMTFYEDPLEGVRAAIDMQRTLSGYNEHKVEIEQIRVRIGLNYGLGFIKEKDVFGDVVNVAKRIESLAKGDQIFISSTVEDKIRSANFPISKIPEVSVKGKTEKLDIYEVFWRDVKHDWAPVAQPRSPTVAARVPVFKASEQGTVVMKRSPVAEVVARPRAQYSLVVVRPDGSPGQACALDKPVTELGRVEGDITFPDDTLVSRRHARFSASEEGVLVEDLKSANGVFWRLRDPHRLQDGDVILMGRQMFRFYAAKQGAAAPPPEKSKPDKAKEAKAAPGAEAGTAELALLLPGGVEETRYPLQRGENILGRTRGTLTFPQDAYLSSQHACIKWDGSESILEDLHAANGTFVALREKRRLRDSDIILIGHQLLRITALPPP